MASHHYNRVHGKEHKGLCVIIGYVLYFIQIVIGIFLFAATIKILRKNQRLPTVILGGRNAIDVVTFRHDGSRHRQ